jgi:NDP-sugar pyrophosphorylase family protein
MIAQTFAESAWRPLIVWHILNLVKAGITDIVINHAHLGQHD